MSRLSSVSFAARLAVLILALAVIISPVFAQGSTGKIDITVVDPDHSVVKGAHLELVDLATNDVRRAETLDVGTYSFINLPIGNYKLTITKEGFTTKVFTPVVVDATKTTDLKISLALGAVVQVVQVEALASAMETTSSAITSTINTTQIENLPLGNRSLNSFAQLSPGYTGTWNGLPVVDEGNNIDGVFGSPERMKFSGNAAPAVQPRLEAIEEMTIQTDQLNLNQGGGQSSMQINFITRRGTNQFHGRLYEDFRNSDLNANTWSNDALGVKKPHYELNDFGASVGGPILHDKLFFFGSYAQSVQPGQVTRSASILSAGAQAGNFAYTASSAPTAAQLAAAPWLTCAGTACTANLLQMAAANGLPNTINGITASELTKINTGVSGGTVATTTDPNLNSVSWNTPQTFTIYYPAVRVDYNVSKKLRINVAWNNTRTAETGYSTAFFPGSNFSNTAADAAFNNYTSALGIDYTFGPHLINQFRGGFLYNVNRFSYDATKSLYSNAPSINWNYGTSGLGGFTTPVTSYYPSFNFTDTLNYQHGGHNFSFGGSWWREQDHYWNPPEGYDTIGLSLSSTDPAVNAFTTGATGTLVNASSTNQGNAENLYAELVGRIGSFSNGSPQQFAFNPKTSQYNNTPGTIGAYNLDELQSAWGLFFEDSWRVRPSLTVNYGLRWDFTGDDHDLGLAYHNSDPSSVFGPTSQSQLFTPGALNGNNNPMLVARPHVYNSWNVAPQPAVGIAWNPNFQEGIVGKVFGANQTVFRAGFSLRDYTEPAQFFWDNASDQGAFFYQTFSLTPSSSTGPGFYTPGALSLPNTLPTTPVPSFAPFTYSLTPATFQSSAAVSQFTFIPGAPGVAGINPNIHQPYVQAWNIGIQRSLGASRAIEIRYNGNHAVRQWLNMNINEVNTQNGFLTEFAQAQNNLAINKAHGTGAQVNSFANYGFPGQVNLPIMSAAFAGEATSTCAGASKDFCNGTYINDLNGGGAGTLAQSLSGANGNGSYFCNMVGAANFGPCVTNLGSTAAGAGYPINFWQANPYATGNGNNADYYINDNGSSNYQALQVDFRQRNWRGLTFDANYTWSKTLGISTSGNYFGSQTNAYTIRNMRLSYLPTAFDIRQVVHMNGTFDLPFGRGKQFLNRSGFVDRVVGGWNVGTVLTYQTGTPFQLSGTGSGGFRTYNNVADSGINLNGVSVQQLQAAVGVYRVTAAQNGGNPVNFVDLINPQYLVAAKGGGANSSFLTPNTTAGVIGATPILYGPHQFADNIALTKNVAITERVHFTFQSEFINAFNHPTFGLPNASIRSTSFGIGGIGGIASPRVIEFRANLTF